MWDLEIAKPVKKERDWDAAKCGKHGISSLVLYDNLTERYHLYDENTLERAADHLNSADLLVGFNNSEFDRPCFQGYTGLALLPPDYDLLAVVWSALGKRQTGWRLGTICEHTLGEGKINHGASAPHLYAEGRFGELFDYNLHDVYLTRKLYNHIVLGNAISNGKRELEITDHPDALA